MKGRYLVSCKVIMNGTEMACEGRARVRCVTHGEYLEAYCHLQCPSSRVRPVLRPGHWCLAAQCHYVSSDMASTEAVLSHNNITPILWHSDININTPVFISFWQKSTQIETLDPSCIDPTTMIWQKVFVPVPSQQKMYWCLAENSGKGTDGLHIELMPYHCCRINARWV